MNSKVDVYFVMLFTLRESLRTPDSVCQGLEVNHYDFTLDALTLKPSGFCNVRVKSASP